MTDSGHKIADDFAVKSADNGRDFRTGGLPGTAANYREDSS
jgi:hypothetical protein